MSQHPLFQDLEQALAQSQVEVLGQLAEQALEELPQEALSYYYYAEWLKQQEDTQPLQTQLLYSKAVDLDEANLLFWRKYAQASVQAQEWQEAAIAYHRILKTYPQDQEALNALGLFELRIQDNPPGAIYYFTQAIELEEQALSYTHRAEAYWKAEEIQAAHADLDYALQLQTLAQSLVLKAEILRSQGADPEQILNVYERLVDLAPDQAPYRFDYARQLLQCQETQKAAEEMNQALNLQTEFPPVFFAQIAEVYHQAAQQDKALFWLQKMQTELDQEQITSSNWKLLAKVYTALEQHQQAADLLFRLRNQALQNQESFAANEILLDLVEVLGPLKRSQELIPELQTLSQDAFWKNEASFALAQIQHQLGQIAQAYYHVQQAAALYPPAKTYLDSNRFDAYLTETRNQILAATPPNPKPAPALNNIQNRFWVFDGFKSDLIDTEALSPEHQAKFKGFFQTHVFFLSDRELFALCPKFGPNSPRAYAYVYEVEKSMNQDFLLKAQPLDGLDAERFMLKIQNPKALLFGRSSKEFYKLKALETKDLSKEQIQKFQELLPPIMRQTASPSLEALLDLLNA